MYRRVCIDVYVRIGVYDSNPLGILDYRDTKSSSFAFVFDRGENDLIIEHHIEGRCLQYDMLVTQVILCFSFLEIVYKDYDVFKYLRLDVVAGLI